MSQEQKTKPQTYAEITAEDIQGWKAKTGHENLKLVEIELEKAVMEGEKEISPAKFARFICVPPTRTVMDALGQHQQTKNIAASNKLLIANCVLGGDFDIMEREGGVYGLLLAEISALSRKHDAVVKNI